MQNLTCSVNQSRTVLRLRNQGRRHTLRKDLRLTSLLSSKHWAVYSKFISYTKPMQMCELDSVDEDTGAQELWSNLSKDIQPLDGKGKMQPRLRGSKAQDPPTPPHCRARERLKANRWHGKTQRAADRNSLGIMRFFSLPLKWYGQVSQKESQFCDCLFLYFCLTIQIKGFNSEYLWEHKALELWSIDSISTSN